MDKYKVSLSLDEWMELKNKVETVICNLLKIADDEGVHQYRLDAELFLNDLDTKILSLQEVQ
jgi:hypothetical protein